MAVSEEKTFAKAAAKEAKTLAKKQALEARQAAVEAKQADLDATMVRVGKLIRKDFKIGLSLHIFENEIWIGSPSSRGSRGWPIAGAHAETVVNGQITQRLTATRMVTLGVFALAVPKKSGNQTLALKVTGPGYSFTYQHQGDVNRAAIQRFDTFADSINTLSGLAMSEASQTASAVSAADELAKFAALHAQGILTDDEFAAKKTQLLA